MIFEYIFIDIYNNIILNRIGVDCMIFGYMRISTGKQDTDRQEITLNEYAKANGFNFDKIVSDRISGTTKAETRPEYSQLKSNLRKGDVLIITDLDRLGRSADDTIVELKELKAKGIKVVALDIPMMNEWSKVADDSMYSMIVDILITLKAHMAEQERVKIVSRINQGLDVARAKGKTLGRPKVELPDSFIKEYKKFKDGKFGDMTAISFSKMLGIGRATLYKYINLYKEQQEEG
jgi:DNA invertase Pin-like site-specific DNA recombinase